MTDIGWQMDLIARWEPTTVRRSRWEAAARGLHALGPFAFSIGTGLPSNGNANGIEMNEAVTSRIW
jgi:hypothetical protein